MGNKKKKGKKKEVAQEQPWLDPILDYEKDDEVEDQGQEEVEEEEEDAEKEEEDGFPEASVPFRRGVGAATATDETMSVTSSQQEDQLAGPNV